MKKVLITGAKGFIGSSLLNFLKTDSEFDLFTTDIESGGNINYVADLREENSLGFIKGLAPQVVVHLAAQSSVPSSILDPIADFKVNALGTINLVRAAVSAGVENIVYVNSGGAIYGSINQLPLTESSEEHPESPYAISKLAGEMFTRYYASSSNIEWSSLALSNCYGPVATNLKGVIYEFHQCLLNNRQPEIFGPYVTRDFVYIDDVLEAIKLAILTPVNCRVHISSGRETSLEELYSNICQVMETEIEPRISEPAFGQVLKSCLGNELAMKLLGWKPQTPLLDGLKLALLDKR